MTGRRRAAVALLALVLATGVYAAPRIKGVVDEAAAGTAFIAKGLCSGVLVAGMEPQRLMDQEFVMGKELVDWEVLTQSGEVETEALFGLARGRALRHPGLGCSLYHDGRPPVPLPQVSRPAPLGPAGTGDPWPIAPFGAQTPPGGVDRDALARVLDDAFSEPDPENPRRTRAVVVVYDGWVVAERYADGVGPTTPLIGWSMTKSLTHALVGVAVGDGLLSLEEPLYAPEWGEEDPRWDITLDQALRMSSGLAFQEVYDDFGSDVVRMLMLSWDMAAVAAAQPLEAEPGTRWHYSSGTTNLISRTLRAAVGEDDRYWRLPYERIFLPLGMHSTVMETDPSGTFVGSSYGYGTARDWARFGLLYLNDGVWNGRRILPEGWVKYGVTPTPGAPRQEYGAHWWLNAGGRFQGIPRDEFRASGYDGQFVMVIPSRNAVIVRMGQTPGDGFDSVAFEVAVLAALPEENQG